MRLLLAAALALAACGPSDPEVTVDGVDPVQRDGDLAPDETIPPGDTDLAPEDGLAPETDLAPDDPLRDETDDR